MDKQEILNAVLDGNSLAATARMASITRERARQIAFEAGLFRCWMCGNMVVDPSLACEKCAAQLDFIRDEELTSDQVAHRTGVSVTKISSIRRRLGIVGKRRRGGPPMALPYPLPDDILDKGNDMRDLAKKYDVSTHTISRARIRSGLRQRKYGPRNHWSAQESARLVDMYKMGIRPTRIASDLKRSAPSVYSHIAKLKSSGVI